MLLNVVAPGASGTCWPGRAGPKNLDPCTGLVRTRSSTAGYTANVKPWNKKQLRCVGSGRLHGRRLLPVPYLPPLTTFTGAGGAARSRLLENSKLHWPLV